jgi:hypothetical protein
VKFLVRVVDNFFELNDYRNLGARRRIVTLSPLAVCLVGEPRERSGAERLPGECSLNMRVLSVPQNSRDGAAPLPFLLSRLLSSPSVSLVSLRLKP